LDPPLPRRAVDWGALTLKLSPTARKGSVAKGPESEKRLRARIERALSRCKDCLLESDAARTWTPEGFALSFARPHRGHHGSRASMTSSSADAAAGRWSPVEVDVVWLCDACEAFAIAGTAEATYGVPPCE
jgi:hypothetical protein